MCNPIVSQVRVCFNAFVMYVQVDMFLLYPGYTSMRCCYYCHYYSKCVGAGAGPIQPRKSSAQQVSSTPGFFVMLVGFHVIRLSFFALLSK